MTRTLLALWLVFACCTAQAAEGDTNIHVFYSDKIERIAPEKSSHVAAVDVFVTLHSNGKVEDKWVVGKHDRGGTKSKLGTTFRVVDSGTIESVRDLGNYILRISIKVSKSECVAQVDHILKPGERNYRIFDPAIKGYATASVLQTVHSECEIK
jgi:hypothetical protein